VRVLVFYSRVPRGDDLPRRHLGRKPECLEELSPRYRFFLLAMSEAWTNVVRSLTIGLWLPEYCSWQRSSGGTGL